MGVLGSSAILAALATMVQPLRLVEQAKGRRRHATSGARAGRDGVSTAAGKRVALAITKVGTKGPDTLIGTKDTDKLRGKGGSDRLIGREGTDDILGGGGNDVIRGGPGSDDDVLRDWGLDGGDGADVIHGGPGDDFLSDGADRAEDRLGGGDGNDGIDAEDSPGARDVIRCGAGKDRAFVDGKDEVRDDCEQVFHIHG
jgi:Ca2+-binding RTX toxin-like protein